MKYLISILILLLAVGAAIGIYSTSPKTRKAIPDRPVPLVETIEIRPGREKVIIEAFGTVIPARSITLQSEVEGRVIGQNPELIPGGLLVEDDLAVQLDPADYELRVSEYKAEMEEAIFELDIEQGKQVIARREWELLGERSSSSLAGKSRALREPHLRLVKARVDKAKIRLDAAELALKRTTIRVPFNSIVLEEFVDKGQLVSKQTPLARIAGTDQFRVQVSVPVSLLKRISLPEGPGEKGSAGRVMFEPLNGKTVVREGYVLKVMGDLDPDGRMARILVVIDDPLNLHIKTGNRKQKFLMGSYVRVRIDAGYFDNVYSVPRQALREGDVLWVQDSEHKLQIRTAHVVWRRKDDVLLSTDLKEGDNLILSRLRSPLPGMRLREAGK